MSKALFLTQLEARKDWRAIASDVHRDQIAEATSPWLDKTIVLAEAANKFSNGTRQETTWRNWLRKHFVIHAQGREKDSDCVILCELRDYRTGVEIYGPKADGKQPKNVRNDNVAKIWAMGADIDGKQSYVEATEKLKAAGVAFVGYSSFNHLKNEDESGKPVEKFRIIIPFSEPVDLSGTGDRFYPLVVTNVLAEFGIALDLACRNEARVWYYPAHAPTFAAEGRAFIDLNHIDHPPFDVTPFVEAAKDQLKRASEEKAKRDKKKKARLSEADAIERNEEVITPWLPRFSSLCGKDFDAQGFVLRIGGTHAQRTGTNAVDCRCSCRNDYPDHCKSSEVDRKTMFVFNGGSTDNEGNTHDRFFINCNHGRCNHRSEVYLDAFIQEHSEGDTSAVALEEIALEFVSDRARKRYLDNRVLPTGFWFKGRFIQAFAGENEVMDVCSRFEVNGKVRDEDSKGWGTEISFTDLAGRSRTAVIRNANLQASDASWRVDLTDNGFWIGTKARQKEAVADLFNRLVTDRTIVTYSRPGWHDTDLGKVHVSVLGKVTGQNDSQLVCRLRHGAGASHRSVAGTMEGWKDSVAGKIDHTVPHFGFCTMVGAAGALIEPLGAASTMFYLLGTSSVGKTAAQICQSSIWGNPVSRKACLIELNATTNASEAILDALNGSTVAFDEVGNADPKLLKGLAFAFASGKGRERLNKNAERRDVFEWQMTGTLSGECTLVDALAKHKIAISQVSGEAVRMPTIDHSHIERTSPEKVDAIKRAARANYGHVGPALVQALFDRGYIADPAMLQARVRQRLRDLAWDAVGTTRRAAEAFAIVWVAGDIMREEALLPPSFDVDAYVRWAWSCFVDFDGAAKLDPIQPAIDRLKTQLQTRPDVLRGSGVPQTDTTQEGFAAFMPPPSTAIRVPFSGAKAYSDGAHYYIPKEFFAEFIGTTAPVAAVIKKLKELGALIPQGAKNNLWSRIPGKATEGESKTLPHYKICAKTLLTDPTNSSPLQHLRLVADSAGGSAPVALSIIEGNALKFYG